VQTLAEPLLRAQVESACSIAERAEWAPVGGPVASAPWEVALMKPVAPDLGSKESVRWGSVPVEPDRPNSVSSGSNPVSVESDRPNSAGLAWVLVSLAGVERAPVVRAPASSRTPHPAPWAATSQGRQTSGPETLDPETLGPETLGPETLGPETLGPETLDPEALGPEALGPETSAVWGRPVPAPP